MYGNSRWPSLERDPTQPLSLKVHCRVRLRAKARVPHNHLYKMGGVEESKFQSKGMHSAQWGLPENAGTLAVSDRVSGPPPGRLHHMVERAGALASGWPGYELRLTGWVTLGTVLNLSEFHHQTKVIKSTLHVCYEN